VLPRAFRYARPDTLAQATALLVSHPEARPLAGGQSLLNVLKLRAAEVDALIDIGRLAELRAIEPTGDGGLELGAGLRYAELASDPLVLERAPMVARVADGLVDVQVRNRGTLGGNICFNDPTSNFPPLLVALGARMKVAGAGAREVAAEDFFLGPFRCALEPGELVRSVVLAPLAADAGLGYQSVQLAEDSWAIARAVAWVRRQASVLEARVVLGCIGARPARQTAVEAALVGTAGDEESVENAAAAPLDAVEPIADAHASAEYRFEMARTCMRRALREALTATEVPA
jgi:aerobic carbon-monoxide dehydrogenase medium subunit